MTIPTHIWRRAALVVSLCAAAAGLYALLHNPDATVETDLRGRSEVHIVLTEEGFEPPYARISLGTTVIFTTTRPHAFWPASNPHPQHTLYPELDPKEPIPANGSWTFVMRKPGLWGYHDHVRSYYTGMLSVE